MKPLLVINRQCVFSEISKDLARPESFSRKSCFKSFANNILPIKILFDCQDNEAVPNIHKYIVANDNIELIRQNCGSGAASYLAALDLALSYKDEYQYVYFIEDDYMHKKGWENILLEGLDLGADYVTLYDHPDKYNYREYPTLRSHIYFTGQTHWREIPSTTDTFACSIKTLAEDIDIHREFSTGVSISRDHHRFLALAERKRRYLISCIPGYSSHMVKEYTSPLHII